MVINSPSSIPNLSCTKNFISTSYNQSMNPSTCRIPINSRSSTKKPKSLWYSTQLWGYLLCSSLQYGFFKTGYVIVISHLSSLISRSYRSRYAKWQVNSITYFYKSPTISLGTFYSWGEPPLQKNVPFHYNQFYFMTFSNDYLIAYLKNH